MLKVRWIEGVPARHREGTTDSQVLTEVVEKRGYRRAKVGFDVEQGEHWLDLGANIGAFAIYCKLRGATAICYEPVKECFEILTRNASGFECVQAAVTAEKTNSIKFYKSRKEENQYRGSILKQGSMIEYDSVDNVWAGNLREEYSGIKMDIEGSEFGIIDNNIIPKCKKLVLEYHSSRDPSAIHLKTRLDALRTRFQHVAYPAELDRIASSQKPVKTFFDRLIHCWND